MYGESRGGLFRMHTPPTAPLVVHSLHSSIPEGARYVHPLSRFRDEVALWVHEEEHGAPVPSARTSFGLPPETFARASFRRSLALESAVAAIPMKDRRSLYAVMREEATLAPDSFLPSLGITVGELCLMQVLSRASKSRSAPRLTDAVAACEATTQVRVSAAPATSPPISPSVAPSHMRSILEFIHSSKKTALKRRKRT